ncbi:MAG TPA: PEGA domain-containing protein [Polyangiaceae bacterium]|nr:PEGA domain-containing protein [Polyangiaceae bacterium]
MRNKAQSARVVIGLVAGLLATTLVAAPASAADAPPKAATGKADAAPAAKPPTKKQKDAARKAYAEGEKAYNSGDYATAVVAFQKANDAIKSPQADYWIAKSLDQQNKTTDAIAAYESFLAAPDSSKVGEQKLNDAKARLDALKATLPAEVMVETDPALASVSVDGAPQPGEPPMTLKLTPGKHRLSVSSNGYQTKDLDIEVKGGEQQKQTIALLKDLPPVAAAAVVAAPPPPAPAPPPPPPEEHSMVPAYVTLGIAGAAAVVGTVFGVKALSSKSDFDKNPTTKTADDTERSALIADMAFGVAITLGVTGIVLLTSDDSPPPKAASHLTLPKRARLDILPYAGPKGGGASAKLTF